MGCWDDGRKERVVGCWVCCGHVVPGGVGFGGLC